MEPDQDVVDVGILAVLPAFELAAVQRTFGIPESEKPSRIGNEKYWLRTIQDNNGKQLHVAVSFVGEQGNSPAAAVATSLIKTLRPRLMILTGTAAGIRGLVKLGDVVPSGLVIDYEGAKLTPDGLKPRFDREKNKRRELMDQVALFDRSAKSGKWLRRFKEAQAILPAGQRPTSPFVPASHVGYVASGEKLLSDGSLEEFQKTHEDRVRAGEKEGFGFAVAANKEGVPWLIVRGISDYGDPKSRDGKDKDKYHPSATNAAAAYIRAFLEEGLDIDQVQRDVGDELLGRHLFDVLGSLKIEAALISAEDKGGLEDLAKFLSSQGVRLIGTPGGQRLLSGLGIKIESTWEFTRTAPLFDYRATLHPYLMACIAVDRNDRAKIAYLRKLGMCPVGLVICNTKLSHPPEEATTVELAERLAHMQVGVPLLLRWGIRHWSTTATVVAPRDYGGLVNNLRNNHMMISPPYRAELFRRTLRYVLDHDRDTADIYDRLWTKNL
jgi:nucleoside phosphorylase